MELEEKSMWDMAEYEVKAEIAKKEIPSTILWQRHVDWILKECLWLDD